MTVVNIATGEIIEPLSAEEAERLTMRISLKLDAMADAYAGVMPLIREAIERGAYSVLGYRSVGEYVSDRFGGALSKLGVDMRREVVRELTAAGMSTRAIATVVDVDQATVVRDLRRDAGASPAQDNLSDAEAGGEVDTVATIEDRPALQSAGSDDAVASVQPQREDDADTIENVEPPAARKVTGIDGKDYTVKPRPKPVALTGSDADYQNAEQACMSLSRAMTILLTFTYPNMRAGMRRYWDMASSEVPPTPRRDVTPEQMRAAAQGLLTLADEWENLS